MVAGVIAVVSAAVLPLRATSPRAVAAASKCSSAGTKTLLSSRQARVFRRTYSRVTVGCLEATGKRTAFDLPPDLVAYPPPAIALAGRLVGYAVEGTDDPNGSDDTIIIVVDLRTGGAPTGWGGRGSPFATSRANSYDAKVGSLRVRANGSVAWIACRTQQNFEEDWGDPRPSCVHPGAFDEVRKLDAAASKPETLDTGRRIDPRSLRLDGQRLYWTKRGKLRSAMLN